MYNIHSHYENIFSFLKTKMLYPILFHFYPFGSIKYDNIEYMHANGPGEIDLPVFLCYDQEPLSENVNTIIQQIRSNWGAGRHVIVLLNTETNSQIKNQILEDHKVIDCNYFFHIFAASDWYRGYQYCTELILPAQRKIKKKFITFNRITGNNRAYRSFFVSELQKYNLIEHGHVSYSEVCPEHGHYEENILETITKHNIDTEYVLKARHHLSKINFPLRIDFKDTKFINNGSQTLNAIPEMMESFLHVVTETCFWEVKDHLTEKIFKPIVAQQPFVLLGCVNNLAYLKRYGFKTFDAWWDEGYDQIDDPILRIQAVVKIINDICNMSNEDLESMLCEMKHVLQHNHDIFYSPNFVNTAWRELTENLQLATAQALRLTSPETLIPNHPDIVDRNTHN